MNKLSKGNIRLSLVCVCFFLLTMCGCSFSLHGFLDSLVDRALEGNSGIVQEGSGSLHESIDAKSLSIDWETGSILFFVDGEDGISFTETCSISVPQGQELAWELNGDTLSIRQYRLHDIKDGVMKDLCIHLPVGGLDEMQINCADVSVNGILQAHELKLSTVSGCMDLILPSCSSFTLKTVSASVVTVFETAPDIVRFDSVVGPFSMTLPKDASFQADFSSLTGTFYSEIPVKTVGPSYLAGDGKASYCFETVSADVSLFSAD